jgi:hypothetical protein
MPSVGQQGKPSMNIELVEAGADEIPVLRRLMQLDLYYLGSLDGWISATMEPTASPPHSDR